MLCHFQKEAGFTAEIRCKSEYHKFLIGRGGSNIKKVRDSTGARVVFPSSQDTDQELITIMGRKDGVATAKTELEELISTLVCLILFSLLVICNYFVYDLQLYYTLL